MRTRTVEAGLFESRLVSLIRRAAFTAALATVSFGPSAAAAQIPDTFVNLQFFPKGISRDELIQNMRGFSFALGVRCQFCHAGGDGISFEGVVFDSDEKPEKRKARFMLRMVQALNTHTLPLLPDRKDPPVAIECATCHRGLNRPRLLGDELALVIDNRGIEAGVERYRRLRDAYYGSGAYDFGEWEMNELGRELRDAGKTEAAIAMLELNAEFYPESASIPFMLGELHEERGERDAAIASYEKTLELMPNHRRAKEKLDALTEGG